MRQHGSPVVVPGPLRLGRLCSLFLLLLLPLLLSGLRGLRNGRARRGGGSLCHLLMSRPLPRGLRRLCARREGENEVAGVSVSRRKRDGHRDNRKRHLHAPASTIRAFTPAT